MSLRPGARLGAYEVLGLIGTGGMGEVHRVRDTKLNRDVALKVLPKSSLNHLDIAAICGLEESDGIRALTLKLMERPTLADGLANL